MPSDEQLTRAQRAAGIDRIGENLALRSGAGCGKTFVLARRFYELLREGGLSDRPVAPAETLSRLVALTFTEKAALEMSSRVREMLADAAADAAADKEQRRRVLTWLDELPEARIATIHGFCASLLRSHAIEAGIDPNFAVCADELLAERLVREAAEEAVLQAVEAERHDVAELLTNLPFDQAVSLVQFLLENRTACELSDYRDADATFDRWGALLSDRRGEWLAPLADDAGLRAELDALSACPCDGSGDKLAAFRDEQLEAIRRILADPAGAPPELFAGLNPRPGNIGSAKPWGGREAVKEVRARLRALIGKVAAFAIFAEPLGEPDRGAARALAALSGLALSARDLHDAEKRRRGLLDFTDLLACTDRLLAAKPDVRRLLARGIDQLLIDECQDTNAFQLRMLARLIGGGTPGQAPPEGKLFAVGDAKQSIYRFRGAQVEVFRGTCDRLGAEHQEHLDESFRTHEAGIAFINHLFAPLMGRAYEPIRAHRKTNPPAPSVEVLLAAGPEEGPVTDAASASAAQAALTAQRIGRMLDAGERIVWDGDAEQWRAVRARDVAILFARMTNSLEYERELQLRGVPYYVVGGTGFFRRQEVFDVLNALQAVDNPLDDIALFGTLRSSLFGLDDNTLMHIAESCRPPYFATLDPSSPPAGMDATQAEDLAAALRLVEGLHRHKDAVGIDVLLERLLDATGYEATLLSQFQGRRMLSNVRMVVDRARAAASEHATLADFLAEMREQVVGESRYEQAAVAGEQEDVVRLMTIHKAKGLEFRVVVVPDLNAGRRGPGGALLLRSDWGLTYRHVEEDTGDGEGADAPLSYRIARRLEEDDARAEDVRRLYVAATRHRDHLIFVGADWRAAAGSFRSSGSYLAEMDGVLGIAAALHDERQEIRYADGRFVARVRRVVPGPPAAAPGQTPPGQRLLAKARSGRDLASEIGRIASPAGALPLVGPLPADVGRVEIAVTALSDFDHCAMLYRWRHELRVPGGFETAGAAGEGRAPAGARALDAATAGTLYHRCMELLNFAGPQDAGALVRRAAGEMELPDTTDLALLEAQLRGMLARFGEHELSARLASAGQAFRELDFVMACGPALLRGQIDLLYADEGGAWHVVDYKSDRVSGAELTARAEQYELQLLLYAAAAARHTGTPPADASLYFLRPAATHTFAASGEALHGAEARAASLAAGLIRSRRSGRFARRANESCRLCPYGRLCDHLGEKA